MLTIRIDSSTPLATQISQGIRRLLAIGSLMPRQPLPTVRQLAGDLGVNLNTVSRAYQDLERSGLIATVRGRGTIVLANREPESADVGRRDADISERLATVLADAKLAGMDEHEIRRVFADQLIKFWPESNPTESEGK